MPAVTPAPSYAQLLAEAMRHGVSVYRYWQLSPACAQCLNVCECHTVNRVAMFCAQTGHESTGLYHMEEVDWNGDNYAMYEGREDLGNIYPGDDAVVLTLARSEPAPGSEIN